MPRLNDSTRDERRTRIATAALRCFARSGIAETSMADVIKESGLSNGSIYSHFGSKADLLRFTISSALESRFLRVVDRGGSPDGATPAVLLAQLLGGDDIAPEQARILIQVWAEVARDPELGVVASENVQRLQSLLGAALRQWVDGRVTDPSERDLLLHRVTDRLITTMFGYAVRLALDPDTDPEALRDSLVASAEDVPLLPAG